MLGPKGNRTRVSRPPGTQLQRWGEAGLPCSCNRAHPGALELRCPSERPHRRKGTGPFQLCSDQSFIRTPPYGREFGHDSSPQSRVVPGERLRREPSATPHKRRSGSLALKELEGGLGGPHFSFILYHHLKNGNSVARTLLRPPSHSSASPSPSPSVVLQSHAS